MALPLLLIAVATAAAAIIAYGVHPGLAHWSQGLDLIMMSRRLQWPLTTFSLLGCIALLGLVIAGKRRAWWLIGLAPVLALFVHRFAPWNGNQFHVIEFTPASQQTIPHDDWWVVGVEFGDHAYALPYRVLYSNPVVFITDYDKRMVLMWSAHANRAVGFTITRELKSRDLEIVSTPRNTVLLYDRRLGQFIVALTGKTPTGGTPIGLSQPITTTKTTWLAWRKQHPTTKLLQGVDRAPAPNGPVLPRDAGQIVDNLPAETRIAMIGTSPPAAVVSDSIDRQLKNIVAGQMRLLVMRDPQTRRLRAFDRNAKEDLFLTFTARTNRRQPNAVMVDSDTQSWWTAAGRAVDGPLKDSQLRELPVEEELHWGAMKRWYPALVQAQ